MFVTSKFRKFYFLFSKWSQIGPSGFRKKTIENSRFEVKDAIVKAVPFLSTHRMEGRINLKTFHKPNKRHVTKVEHQIKSFGSVNIFEDAITTLHLRSWKPRMAETIVLSGRNSNEAGSLTGQQRKPPQHEHQPKRLKILLKFRTVLRELAPSQANIDSSTRESQP